MDKQPSLQFKQLQQAQAFMERVLATPEDEIQRAAAIQSFEVCFELAWKHLKQLVEDNGAFVASPKAVFREAAKYGIIDNPGQWFDFLAARNGTVHTYAESTAEETYGLIKNDFSRALAEFIKQAAQEI